MADRKTIVVDGMSWGARVKKRRQDLTLSQAALARRCDVAQQTIDKVERDKIQARDELKVAIARGLVCSVAELFPWPTGVPKDEVA